MTSDHSTLKVGTRRSQLALRQSEIVVDLLAEKFPHAKFEIVPMTTRGDEVLDSALPKIGAKNLFTHELEVALLTGKVDIVVHSLKDLATQVTEGTCIPAIIKRDSKNDVVVFRDGPSCGFHLENLPPSSVVGTSSVRRVALLKQHYSHLQVKNIRGNLNTRLRKLDALEEGYDAIILASAGLNRLGLQHRIGQTLCEEHWPYAVSQGAIAVQCRINDLHTIEMLLKLNHESTMLECLAERAFMKKLQGGCSVPVAVTCKVHLDPVDISKSRIDFHGSVHSVNTSCNPEISESLSCPLEIYDERNDLYHQKQPLLRGGVVSPKNHPTMLHKMEVALRIGDDAAKSLLAQGALIMIEHAKMAVAQMK